MASEVDDVILKANELIARTSARYQRSGRKLARIRRDWTRRLKRMTIAVAVVLIGAAIAGFLLGGIGTTGILLVLGLLIACLSLAFISTEERVEEPARLAQADLKTLPHKTEIWLDNQRRALPAPAIPIVNAISNRLDTLAPQLAKLDPREPAAVEVRRLLSDHLPELVTGYQSIPEPLRHVPRNGRVPDAQLVEGLSVIEQEIANMTAQLADGDLDKLAVHNRYLELKYQEAKTLGN
jgi:hypothetical protein